MQTREIAEYEYLTPSEIAAKLGVHRRTVTLWLRAGTLQGYLTGRRWLVPKTSFAAFMEAADNSRLAPAGAAPVVAPAIVAPPALHSEPAPVAVPPSPAPVARPNANPLANKKNRNNSRRRS